jgi:PAS domain S-box-containing protein
VEQCSSFAVADGWGAASTVTGNALRDAIDFAALFAQLPSPYMILDSQLRFIDANAAYLEVTGRRREDIVGRFVFDAFPEEGEPRLLFEGAFRRALAGEANVITRREFRIARPASEGSGLRNVIWTTHQIPVRDRAGQIIGMLQKALDVTAEVQAEQLRETIIGEFDHRLRNLFAKMAAISQLTAREEHQLKPYLAKQQARFAALARTQSVLMRAPDEGAELADVIRSELDPFGADGIEPGPKVRLNPASAQSLGMAFHELATNAAKHGALGKDGGRLRVGWSISAGQAPRLEIDWRETGYPASPPSRAGFGTTIIERLLTHDHGATVERRFDGDGHHTLIAMPLDRVVHSRV